MKHAIASLIMGFSVVAASTTHAAAYIPNLNTGQPIERFTRSLSALYVALASCSFITPHGNVAPVLRIKDYMSGLYPEGPPYWALPKIHSQIDDEDICNFLIYDRMITYLQARIDFTKTYPNRVMPPEFVPEKPRVFYTVTEDFLKFGNDGNLDVKTMKRSLSIEY